MCVEIIQNGFTSASQNNFASKTLLLPPAPPKPRATVLRARLPHPGGVSRASMARLVSRQHLSNNDEWLRWFPDGAKWQLPLEAHVNRMRGAFRRLRRPLSVTAAAPPPKRRVDVCCCKTEGGDYRSVFSESLCDGLLWTRASVTILRSLSHFSSLC